MDRKRTAATAMPVEDLLRKIDEVSATAVRTLAIGLVRARKVRPDQAEKYSPEWWAVVEQVAAGIEAERPDLTPMELMDHAMNLLDATRRHVAVQLALWEGGK